MLFIGGERLEADVARFKRALLPRRLGRKTHTPAAYSHSVHSTVHSFVRPSIRSFVRSIVRSFVRSIDRSFVRSFVGVTYSRRLMVSNEENRGIRGFTHRRSLSFGRERARERYE